MAEDTINVPASPHDSNTFEVIIIFILVIILLVVITLAVYYLLRNSQCWTYPSPWCYNDWICENLPPGEQNRWDVLRKLRVSSVPPSSGFCFIPENQSGADGGCPNAWADLLTGNNTCTPVGAGANNSVPCGKTYLQNADSTPAS